MDTTWPYHTGNLSGAQSAQRSVYMQLQLDAAAQRLEMEIEESLGREVAERMDELRKDSREKSDVTRSPEGSPSDASPSDVSPSDVSPSLDVSPSEVSPSSDVSPSSQDADLSPDTPS